MSDVVGGPSSTDTESLFRRVLDASPDLLVDPRSARHRSAGGTVRQASVLGYQSSEFKRTTPPRARSSRRRCLTRRRSIVWGAGMTPVSTSAFQLSRSDGMWTTCRHERAALSVLDDGGATVGIVAASRDVTNRRRAEQKLRLAVTDAEPASQAKSEFLSRMSHELRTPLLGARLDELLEMDELLGEAGGSHRTHPASRRHLLGLIDEVLRHRDGSRWIIWIS